MLASTLNELDFAHSTAFTSAPPKAVLRSSGSHAAHARPNKVMSRVEASTSVAAYSQVLRAAQAEAIKRAKQQEQGASKLSRMGVQAFVFEIQVSTPPIVRRVRLLDTSAERAWSRLLTIYKNAKQLSMTVEAS